MNMRERYERLYSIIANPDFLVNSSPANDLPIYICPYPPEAAAEIHKRNASLFARLQNQGINVLEINLYDLALDLLRQRGYLERLLQEEPEIPKGAKLEYLRGTLDPEQNLAPAIQARVQAADYAVLFLTGIGEVFPFIRTQALLGNLPRIATARPLILFFPGEYRDSAEDGPSLDLFGRLKNDKYYRAFNIFSCQPGVE